MQLNTLETESLRRKDLILMEIAATMTNLKLIYAEKKLFLGSY